MPIPKRTLRGVRDIRTISGRVDQADEAYKLYMKLSSLERGKVRLNNEREGTLLRLREIEARLHELRAEERAILQILGRIDPGTGPMDAEPEEATDADGDADGERFTIRY